LLDIVSPDWQHRTAGQSGFLSAFDPTAHPNTGLTVIEDGLEATFALNHMSYFVVTGFAGPTLGLGIRTHHQHSLGSASGRHFGFRRSSIRKKLQSPERLWLLEAMQYLVYTRTCSAPAWHWGDSELSASWLRSNTFRGRKWRFGLALSLARQVFCNIFHRRRSNNRLSRVLARGGQCDPKILLQVPSDCALGTGVGRPRCFGIVGAQCDLGALKEIADLLAKTD
jgi:hypothetical protein